MRSPWPTPSPRLIDADAEAHVERLKSVVTAIRNTRAELHVPLDSRPPIRLASSQPTVRTFFHTHRALLQALALVGDVDVETARRRIPSTPPPTGGVARDSGPTKSGLHKHAAAMVVDGVELLMPLAGLIDPARERQRLQQRTDDLRKQLAHVEARLRDKQFIRKAPKDVVEQAKARRAQARETLKRVSDHLAVLQSM